MASIVYVANLPADVRNSEVRGPAGHLRTRAAPLALPCTHAPALRVPLLRPLRASAQ